MKSTIAVALVLIALAGATVQRENVSPIEKVLTMMSDLKAKIGAEEAEAKALYDETAALCTKKIKTTGFAIKTGKSTVSKLSAQIEEESATITSCMSKVEELSAFIAGKQAELKKATELRAKEASEYEAELKELNEIIDTLQRAIAILERSSSASMLQLKGAKSVVDALGVMVRASALSSADAERLTALVQSSQGDEADDSEDSVGAPAGPVYESKSGGIIDTLSDMLDKAEEQRASAQKAETKSIGEFKMMEQSLTDAIKFSTKELSETKKASAESKEKKSYYFGDITVTKKTLTADIETKSVTEKECMDAAAVYQEESKSRKEEMKALTEAAKAVKEATSTSFSQTQISFLQVERKSSARATGLDFQVVHFVRNLGHKHKSAALTQLAIRLANVMHRSAARGGDPFKKVKDLIMDMIDKLQDEGSKEASQKAFCDKELAENEASKADHEADIESYSTKLDAASAALAKLKSDMADIEKSLAAAAAEYVEETKIRQEEHELYVKTKAEEEKGLEGTKLAMKVLQEYYAKGTSTSSDNADAGGGILSMLEVIESDFSQSLAELQTNEESAASDYEASTKQYEIEKAESEADVKYKGKESAELASTISELETDKSASLDGLASVNEYLDKIKKQCVAKPDTFAQRIEKLKAEIAGLKEALTILDGGAMLLQRGKAHRALRGLSRH